MYTLHLSKRNFHFIAVRWSSVRLVNSSVCNTEDLLSILTYRWFFRWIWKPGDPPHCAAQRLLRFRAPQCTAVQGARVVAEIQQQVEACGGWKGLTLPRTELVGAAQCILSGHELAPRTEKKRVSSNQWFIQPMHFIKWILKSESDSDGQRQRNWLHVHWTVLNAPSCPDDFRDRGVEVKLGDEAVRDSKENLWTLPSLLLQLAHCVHVSDGVHCRDKVRATYSHLTSSESRLKQFSSTKRCCLTWLFS